MAAGATLVGPFMEDGSAGKGLFAAHGRLGWGDVCFLCPQGCGSRRDSCPENTAWVNLLPSVAVGRTAEMVTDNEERRQPVRRMVLADMVHDSILSMLMNGDFAPGDNLRIESLANRLGVSPTPVREALVRLESPGLVRRTALKGYKVSPLLVGPELEDLFEARLLIEPALARKAAMNSTPEFVAELDRLMHAQETASTGPDFSAYKDFLVADEAFHATLAVQGHNRFLISAYDALGGQIQRFRFFAGQGVTDANFAIAEHRVILEAIIHGTPDDVEKASATHVRNVAARARSEAEHLSSGKVESS